jgi:hypothetical protein
MIPSRYFSAEYCFEGVPHPFRVVCGKGGPLVYSGMPRRLKRYYGRGHLHFITCSCYRRLPLLGSARARSVFVKVLGEDRINVMITGLAIVILVI